MDYLSFYLYYKESGPLHRPFTASRPVWMVRTSWPISRRWSFIFIWVGMIALRVSGEVIGFHKLTAYFTIESQEGANISFSYSGKMSSKCEFKNFYSVS